MFRQISIIFKSSYISLNINDYKYVLIFHLLVFFWNNVCNISLFTGEDHCFKPISLLIDFHYGDASFHFVITLTDLKDKVVDLCQLGSRSEQQISRKKMGLTTFWCCLFI